MSSELNKVDGNERSNPDISFKHRKSKEIGLDEKAAQSSEGSEVLEIYCLYESGDNFGE